MKKRNRRIFTTEFKREAIRMVDETDKTISDVSRELGINSNLIGRWKKEQSTLELESGRIDDKDAEVRDLKEDRDILKKAAAYFAKNSR